MAKNAVAPDMPSICLSKNESQFKKLMRASFSCMGKTFWPILPKFIYQDISIRHLCLALTRVCNIDCVFCPYQFGKKDEKTHMSDETFKRVLDGIGKAKVRAIMLSPDIGEPLLAPNFIDRMRQLRSHGVKLIELTTNGTVLHKIGIEVILREGPDKINISFPGFNEAMYERICRASTYQQTRSNILNLLKTNQLMARPKQINIWLRPDIGIKNLMGAPEMRLVEKIANEIAVMTEVDDFSGSIKQEMLPEGLKVQDVKPPLTKRPCGMLLELTVHPDGDIHLCACRNIFKEPMLHIGNIQKMDLLEAYLKIPDILKAWQRGCIPDICKKCSMYSDPADTILGRSRRILSRRLFGSWYF